MRRVAAVAIFAALVATIASAQKVMIPQQSSNPNVILTPPNASQNIDNARRIARDEAIKLVKEGKAVFVDVRGKDSYDASHIKGAISIPESQILTRLKELPPKKMIITYCA
ncbi:MAG TPA: rhodanese-like domain-containing protein [Thermoanaerobaculia bacterium]|nr:rhodanese-like domain-containing protein [Thermoanaerobaculia bacterium]